MVLAVGWQLVHNLIAVPRQSGNNGPSGMIEKVSSIKTNDECGNGVTTQCTAWLGERVMVAAGGAGSKHIVLNQARRLRRNAGRGRAVEKGMYERHVCNSECDEREQARRAS